LKRAHCSPLNDSSRFPAKSTRSNSSKEIFRGRMERLSRLKLVSS
jgi:hypothetical protein